MAPLNKEMQHLQELLAHPGWAIFKDLALGANSPDPNRKSLKERLQADLLSAGRSGEVNKSAQFAGQLDILPVILSLPEKELEKAVRN